jgi:hypothetical protein
MAIVIPNEPIVKEANHGWHVVQAALRAHPYVGHQHSTPSSPGQPGGVCTEQRRGRTQGTQQYCAGSTGAAKMSYQGDAMLSYHTCCHTCCPLTYCHVICGTCLLHAILVHSHCAAQMYIISTWLSVPLPECHARAHWVSPCGGTPVLRFLRACWCACPPT